MKKIIISSFIIIVAATVLLSLSSKKESNYNLHLVIHTWSEQGTDYPEEEFDFENITLNKTYAIPLEENTYYLREFKVVKIGERSITISTSIPLSNKENGIDFDSNKRKFTIEDGMSLNLDTLTMDAGEGYYFTLMKKE